MNDQHAIGSSATVAALVLSVLTEDEVDLHWCVDLTPYGEWPDPSDRESTLPWWNDMLERLKSALDHYPPGGATRSMFRLNVRHTWQGQRTLTSFKLGYPANIRWFMRDRPPVGFWCLVGRQYAPRAGQLAPWWYEEVPF